MDTPMDRILPQRTSGTFPRILLTSFSLLLSSFAPLLHGVELRVDGSQRLGTIRPLHGVNNGPLNQGETVDLSEYYRQAGFPLARLHDSEWPDPDIVDIHAVFPDMNADPEKADGYDFSRTDDYLSAIVNTGTGIVYRLGESIEHTRKKYRVNPPADMDKWAKICVGIIRHYNEGWAGGFRHNIRYWEIWNEPENRPAMWTGTDEQYFRMYVTAARAIKSAFPDLKVGGPSIGYPGDMEGDTLKPTDFLKAFLKTCKEQPAPLDFFSWHTYTNDPFVYAKKARAIRKLLNEYGFAKTEIHLNEWNILPENNWQPMLAGQGLERRRWYDIMGGPEGASFLACVLSDLQDSPVDVGNYYSGETSAFGLFDRVAVPKKTYYAMRAFRMLLDTPNRVRAQGWDSEQGTILAGSNADGSQWTVLVSCHRSREAELKLTIAGLAKAAYHWQFFLLDAQNNLEPVRAGDLAEDGVIAGRLNGPCVIVVRLQR
jgi:xylan 1,4-beta-xylosidase